MNIRQPTGAHAKFLLSAISVTAVAGYLGKILIGGIAAMIAAVFRIAADGAAA